MRVTVIHNPSAGEGERGESLVAELTTAGHNVSYVDAKKADLDEALKDVGDLVLVAGGDGTVRKVASRMLGREIPIIVVPLGTANNIAATLGVHDRPDHLAEYLETLTPMPFDIGRWTHGEKANPFLESVGLGVLTNLMAELSTRKRSKRVEDRERGFADELEVLHKIVEKMDPVAVHMTADGEDASGNYLLVEVMNIRSVGPKVMLAPHADPSDGFFDLVAVTEAERDQLLAFVEAIRQRKPVPDLPTRRVREVKVECAGCRVHMDDQLTDVEDEPFVVRIEPGALTMFTPPSMEDTGRRKIPDRRASLRP